MTLVGHAAPVRVIGAYLSPYVRKVLAVLELKELRYEIDPIVPYMGDDRFTSLSPLRRVPVLIDDQVTLADSTVICQYLDDRYPSPPIYPVDVADRAHARWLEEYADSRMGDVFIWGLYNEAVIRPAVWGSPRDLVAIERTTTDDIPPILDYLESRLPSSGWLFGSLGIADISIAVFSAMLPLPASASMQSAGRSLRPSSAGSWRKTASRNCRSSKA
jgi:glutathione S-transferase